MNLAIVMPSIYGQNRAFDPDSPLNRDDCLAHLRHLRERLKGMGISLSTYDMVSPEDTWGYLFLDYQDKFMEELDRRGYGGHRYLAIFESEVIIGDNWDREKHRAFDAVFTWNRNAFPKRDGGPRYIPYMWPNDLTPPVDVSLKKDRQKLCVLMAGNKWSSDRRELYSCRRETIRWFEKHHPDELDLYGPGWNSPPLKRVANTVKAIGRKLRGRPTGPIGDLWETFSCYRGIAPSKRKTLPNYGFSICYENAQGIPGYITEKIFDCFLSGVVPVYMGWEDVQEVIPSECYVDRRAYGSHEELYRYLVSMPEDEYRGYLEGASSFLTGSSSDRFSLDAFADAIIEGIEPDLAKEGNKP